MPAGIGGRDNRMNAEVGWGEDLSDLPDMGTENREKPQQLICYRVRVRLDLEERNEGLQLDYLLLLLKRPVSFQEPHRWSCCLDKGGRLEVKICVYWRWGKGGMGGCSVWSAAELGRRLGNWFCNSGGKVKM